jgi:fructokinase
MPKIYAIGETILDIIFDADHQPVAAKPGGSMLNSAVCLGRCGLNVEMITELGDDTVGRLVLDFLKTNGVSVSCIKPVKKLKTPVSLAFLDHEGKADFSFYKKYPEKRLDIQWPEISPGDVVLFGSFYSLNDGVRQKIIPFIKRAKQAGGIIIYDPNLRKNHMEEIRQLMHLVDENLSLADIVRGSDEDFGNLFGLAQERAIFEMVSHTGCRNLVITKGSKGADLLTDHLTIHARANRVKVISTIGAGDAFNAGLIYGLIKNGLTVHQPVNINRELWQKILSFGITFARNVCGSYDNYISIDFARELIDYELHKQN